MIKIAIDITSILDQYSNRGIGTYTRNLVYELIKHENLNIHLLGYKTEQDNLNKLNIDKFPTNVRFHSLGSIKPSTVKNIMNSRKEFLPILKQIEPQVYICPNFERGIFNKQSWKNIVVIHDIIPLITGKFSSKSLLHNLIKKRFYLSQLKKALEADHIITVSQYSKRKLQSFFNIPDSKITVDYLALDIEFQKKLELQPRRANVILKSLRIKNKYILYYGGLEENKNVSKLIEAFKEVSGKVNDIDLVIVSNEIRDRHDNNYIIKGEGGKRIAKLVNKHRLHNRIIFPGELGKEDLKILTSKAQAFVHLSKFEGFGLSVLEAISLGTPVLLSDIPVYKELYYKNAVLVNPDDTEEIARNIIELVNNIELQSKLKEEKTELLNKLTWDKHVSKFIDIVGVLLKQERLEDDDKNSNRSKLAYVIPHFYPFKGGAENYTLDIATLAARNNFDVSVYTSKNTRFENEFDVFHRLKIYRSPVWIKQYYLKFYPKLYDYIVNSNCEIIHVQGFGFIWQDICLIIKKFLHRKKVKYINTPHGPFMARQSYNKFQLFIKILFTSIQKLYLNWLYESIIQVNPEQYKWIEKEYGIRKSKIKFLPIGVTDEHFHPSIVTNKIQKRFAELEDKIILTYVGRFHKYKGVSDILVALKRVLTETDIQDIHLVLMGKDAGELKQLNKFIIENRLEDNVDIIESPTDEVRNYILDQSQIFVFPSEWEAYGIAMLEAMAHGNAIISTRTEGGLYLIKNNTNGILYNYGNTNELFKAMIRLIGNFELRKQIIENNYAKALDLRWEKIWPEYEALYRSLTN